MILVHNWFEELRRLVPTDVALVQIRPVLSFPQKFCTSGTTRSVPIYEQCGARRDNFRDSRA